MELEYKIGNTKDGTPTMEIKSPSGVWSEAMHNTEGALSESLYVYYNAIQFLNQQNWNPYYLSAGLGLGYNEMIISAHSLKYPETSQNLYVESFEIEDDLRNGFLQWLSGQAPNQFSEKLWEAYERALDSIARYFAMDGNAIRGQLLQLFLNKQWLLRKELNKDTLFSRKFSCILYDLFSAQTLPDLWTQDALTQVIKKISAPNCVFSTYSSIGDLNRALRSNGFLLEDFKGFGEKRSSTFAIKATAIKVSHSGGMLPSS